MGTRSQRSGGKSLTVGETCQSYTLLPTTRERYKGPLASVQDRKPCRLSCSLTIWVIISLRDGLGPFWSCNYFTDRIYIVWQSRLITFFTTDVLWPETPVPEEDKVIQKNEEHLSESRGTCVIRTSVVVRITVIKRYHRDREGCRNGWIVWTEVGSSEFSS